MNKASADLGKIAKLRGEAPGAGVAREPGLAERAAAPRVVPTEDV